MNRRKKTSHSVVQRQQADVRTLFKLFLVSLAVSVLAYLRNDCFKESLMCLGLAAVALGIVKIYSLGARQTK